MSDKSTGFVKATGTLFYNGFLFPGPVKITVKSIPIRDESKRFTKYNRFTLEVEFIVHPGVDEDGAGTIYADGEREFQQTPAVFPIGQTLDYGMQTLRRILLQQGGRLYYSGKGFGTIDTDTAAGQIKNGPRPLKMDWFPIGENKAAKVIWSIETDFVDCPLGIPGVGSIAEANSTFAYSFDVSGATTVTQTGYVEITNGLRPDGRPLVNIELVRQRLNGGPIPLRFRRTKNNWVISSDRTRIDFEVTDEEITGDHAYYPGVAEITATQTLVNKTLFGDKEAKWSLSINVNTTAAMNKPKWVGWFAFLEIVQRNLAAAESNITAKKYEVQGKVTGIPASQSPVIILRKVRITENIFTRQMSFSLSYDIVAQINSVLKQAAFWELGGKLRHTDKWEEYRKSMTQGKGAPWTSTGSSNIAITYTHDKITSLCDVVRSSGGTSSRKNEDRVSPPKDSRIGSKFTEIGSYLSFNPGTTITQKRNSTVHTCLGSQDAIPSSSDTRRRSNKIPLMKADSLDTSGGRSVLQTGQLSTIVQERSASEWYVIYYGTARRIGWRVNQPSMLQYGDLKLSAGDYTLVETSFFEQWPGETTADDHIIWYGRWRQKYRLNRLPKAEFFEQNPTFLNQAKP